MTDKVRPARGCGRSSVRPAPPSSDEIMHRFTDLQYALTLALDEAIERRLQAARRAHRQHRQVPGGGQGGTGEAQGRAEHRTGRLSAPASNRLTRSSCGYVHWRRTHPRTRPTRRPKRKGVGSWTGTGNGRSRATSPTPVTPPTSAATAAVTPATGRGSGTRSAATATGRGSTATTTSAATRGPHGGDDLEEPLGTEHAAEAYDQSVDQSAPVRP